MIVRRDVVKGLAAATGFGALMTSLPARADWRDSVKELRIGILGGENEADRIARFDPFRDLVSKHFGVPAKLFPASDYAGVMQAWSARQLEFGILSPSAYAGIWLDSDGNIEPAVLTKESDGSTGYYAVVYVRADSPYQSLDDLKGQSIAFADPNSASGYLVPRSEMREQGKDPESFFSRTGFAGGHEQGVIAVLQKQYDAGVTWSSGIGDVTKGYTRGALTAMVQKGMLDMSKLRIIWRSRKIPNGPFGMRKDLPADLKQEMRDFMMKLPVAFPEVYKAIERGNGAGYELATHEIYEPLIAMRRAEAKSRRAR